MPAKHGGRRRGTGRPLRTLGARTSVRLRACRRQVGGHAGALPPAPGRRPSGRAGGFAKAWAGAPPWVRVRLAAASGEGRVGARPRTRFLKARAAASDGTAFPGRRMCAGVKHREQCRRSMPAGEGVPVDAHLEAEPYIRRLQLQQRVPKCAEWRRPPCDWIHMAGEVRRNTGSFPVNALEEE